MTVDELMAELHTMIVTHGCGGDQVVVDIDYQSETVTVPIVAVESFDVGVGLVPGPRSRALARQRNAR